MMEPPDTTVVDLHRLSGTGHVAALEGSGWWVPEKGDAQPLRLGQAVVVGDTLALDPGAVVRVGGEVMLGGRRGRAHSFVAPDAFRTTPNRDDLPRLLQQLSEIERDLQGIDPMDFDEESPETPHEKAVSAEFARLNLTAEASRSLGELTARKWRAVVLFYSSDAAYVAMEQVGVKRLRALVEALGRPVTPHLVDSEVMEELLGKVYGPA